MKKILAPFVVTALFLASCSTRVLKTSPAPSIEQVNVLRNSLNSSKFTQEIDEGNSLSLARAYLAAMKAQQEGDRVGACSLFLELADLKSFTLWDAARIHSLINCELSPRQLKKIWKKEVVSNYLKAFYLEVSRSIASKNKLRDQEAEFSYELIAYQNQSSEKEALINQSLAIAKELADLEKIKKYNDKLKEISPLHLAPEEINETNLLSVAKDFESHRNFEQARILYTKIIDGDFAIDQKVKAFNALRISYKIERNLKKFLEETYAMENFLKEKLEKKPNDIKLSEFWAESKIVLARAVWTNHQSEIAKEVLGDFFSSNRGTLNQKANAYYIYGSLYLESKKNKEALRYFEKASNLKPNDLTLQENIQWAIVWNHYLLKNYSKVISLAASFTKKSQNPTFIAKLNFWSAKALRSTGKTQAAIDLFTTISLSDSFGYYGIISAMELKKPLEPLSSAPLDYSYTGRLDLDWLLAMDEKIFAQKLLKEIDSQFKAPSEREKVMSLYAQTQWYQGGMRQIYNFKMSSRNSLTEKYIDVLFPTPNLKLVEVLSQKYNVPKELIFAITRQESAFVANERSWADAFGLMQMIPEKAQELSKKYNIPFQGYLDLYRPEINIEFGTALLKDLREKFHSKFAQSVAAYNASENVIKTWEQERFNGDYLEFIEMIPYEETRNYIKLVFRNYVIYKRKTSTKSFFLETKFFANAF